MNAVEAGPIAYCRWTANAIAETVGWAESFALDRAVTPAQRNPMNAVFAGLRQQIQVWDHAAEQGIKPARKHFGEVAKRPEKAHISAERRARLWHRCSLDATCGHAH